MFTANMLLVLLAAAIYEYHLNNVAVAMPNLLADPVSSTQAELARSLPFRFGGGLGFKPRQLSWYSAVFGMSCRGVPIHSNTRTPQTTR